MAIWDIKKRYKVAMAYDNRPTRAVEMGGYEPAGTKNGTYMNMDSQATSVDFGDLIDPRVLAGGMTSSNTTRGLFHSAEEPGSNPTDIDLITMASTGNASDYGDLTIGKGYGAATSNGIYAISAGGNTVIDVIDFGPIAQTGNFVDFGDLTVARNQVVGICNPTRGLFAGGTDGSSPSPAGKNVIDYITINSKGDATDFGDLTGTAAAMGVSGTATRGFFIGNHPGVGNKDGKGMDVINFASTGNATDFGDVQGTLIRAAANACNGKYGFSLGGATPGITNMVQKFNMTSLGSMVDWSDLSSARQDSKGATGAHDGIDWDSISVQRPSVTYMPGSGRGFIAGGNSPHKTIDLIHIPTLGNGSDFGDLNAAHKGTASFSSLTRGIWTASNTPDFNDDIDSLELASTGNAADFGNLTQARGRPVGLSSTTRGITAGGQAGSSPDYTEYNILDYVTITTAGNAADFGDLTAARWSGGSFASSTRGVVGGGRGDAYSDIIDYITIASTGDATDFGDLAAATSYLAGCGSSVRGVFGGGYAGPAALNVIQYVTIASTGNTSDFGDRTVSTYLNAGLSNNTRGIFAGGLSPATNVIDYVTIASTGDAADFGDLTAANAQQGGLSDSHGGLQA
tara:strand:- start:40 stop:1917 length:1878 start_codon:yes stop_codon:yes gene_type:complete